MNRDDIIDLADKAGFEICRGDGWPDERLIEKLMRFVALYDALAAPELLQVCKELEECSGYWSEYDVPLGIVDRLRAAISKCEGTA